jgi:hypothetical protein
MPDKKEKADLRLHHQEFLAPRLGPAPFVLRITEWKDYPKPVLVIKERRQIPAKIKKGAGTDGQMALPMELPVETVLYEIGHISGNSLWRCLNTIKKIVTPVMDKNGIPLELQRYLNKEVMNKFVNSNLPLDEEAGAKLGLIFKLHLRLLEMDRVELLARRVARFTREESAYWLSWLTRPEADATRWAVSGLRIMLGGLSGDPAVPRMLKKLVHG